MERQEGIGSGNEAVSVDGIGGDDKNESDNNSNEKIANSIFDFLLDRVLTEVACNLHSLIKTGEIPLAKLKEPFTRQELYPELYDGLDDQDIDSILDKYSTERLLERHMKGKKRPHSQLSGDVNGDSKEADGPSDPSSAISPSSLKNEAAVSASSDGGGESKPSVADGSATGTTPAPTMQTRQALNHTDIWGRIPPKEPKQNVECRICGRQVSALRFAPHLDKCMGLSMARGSSG